MKNFCFQFQFRISLLNAPFVNFWKLATPGWHLPNNREMTKFYFQLVFVRSYERYIEPPLLPLSIVLCLISPDFATCSLALHKHVVSDVIKMLNTFANIAISTLAPMFINCIFFSQKNFVF